MLIKECDKNVTKLFTVNALLAGKFFIFFLPSSDFVFILILFTKYSFKNTIRVSNSSGQVQARHFVGPNLGPNCLQGVSAYGTSRDKE